MALEPEMDGSHLLTAVVMPSKPDYGREREAVIKIAHAEMIQAPKGGHEHAVIRKCFEMLKRLFGIDNLAIDQAEPDRSNARDPSFGGHTPVRVQPFNLRPPGFLRKTAESDWSQTGVLTERNGSRFSS